MVVTSLRRQSSEGEWLRARAALASFHRGWQATCDARPERRVWFRWLVLGGSAGLTGSIPPLNAKGLSLSAAPEPPTAFVLRQPNFLNWNNRLCSLGCSSIHAVGKIPGFNDPHAHSRRTTARGTMRHAWCICGWNACWWKLVSEISYHVWRQQTQCLLVWSATHQHTCTSVSRR